MTVFPTHVDVVVVGAGTAGLSAAQALRQAGLETLVLEAAGHIGGRCVTDTGAFVAPFDRGGSWLHSAPINPLAALADHGGTPLHKAAWERTWVHSMGHDLSDAEVLAFRDYETRMWDAINDAGKRAVDCTTLAALPDGPYVPTAAHALSQMLGGDADVTSARDTYNYADAEGDWLVEGGLGAFVARLHADVSVRLNCPVTKIDYSGVGVLITTPQGTVRATQIILTVSTGVLAAGGITFVPALPVSKQEAVDLLPCGLLNKVGIEFDPEWALAAQGQMLDYHSREADFCSVLFGFYDSPLAVGFVSGRCADELERQGAGAATDYCLEALRSTFGADVTKSIQRTDETAWRGNPLTFGSYSYARPGAVDARQTLAAPLADRVFFAGEATETETYATVHGAYLSGKRAANEVIAVQTSVHLDAIV